MVFMKLHNLIWRQLFISNQRLFNKIAGQTFASVFKSLLIEIRVKIMETESIIDENHKRGRVRRKQTRNTILKQMHFYFSDSNLAKDRFLGQKLKESEYIDLEVFLSFNKIQKLTSTVEEIAKAIRKSDVLELNEDGTKVKRILPVKVKLNEDECTIYVQTLQPDTNHEWLINVFSEFGKVEYVSIPKYAHNKLSKGFAFVEYENEEQVKTALGYFESVGLRISLQIDAEQLCSNRTYDEEQAKSEPANDVEQSEAEKTGLEKTESKNKSTDEAKESVESDGTDKKRKHQDDGTDEGSKKFKAVNVDEELDDTKRKKRSSKRKAQIKELGLQVLTKLEWKKLRNRYWDMQRKKMKQLKQHLNKRRFQQNNYLDVKNTKTQNVDDLKTNTDKEKEKNDYTPGVIVKLKMFEPWTDAKKVKVELKNAHNTIDYVEVPTTLASDEVYLRFASADSAKEFCGNNAKGAGQVLEHEEEKQYWEKIKVNRDARLHKDVKKQRGRDKLLKRAERELGKHIRFDATDD